MKLHLVKIKVAPGFLSNYLHAGCQPGIDWNVEATTQNLQCDLSYSATCFSNCKKNEWAYLTFPPFWLKHHVKGNSKIDVRTGACNT